MSVMVKSFEAIKNFGPQIVGLATGGNTSSTSKAKKKYRYKTIHNGRVLRKHYTKKTANAYAKEFGYGARVVTIGAKVTRKKKKVAKKRPSYASAPRVIYVEKRKPEYKKYHKKKKKR